MNIIIALLGRGNSGKLSSIRLLYDLFLQKAYKLISSNFNTAGGNYLALFSKNGKLIGVSSSGDTYDLVHDRLEEFVYLNCNICICACRTFDKIPSGINATIIEFTNYSNQFVKKIVDDSDSTHATTNISDARNFFSIINGMIK